VLRRMSTVIDVDLSRYFDTIRHSVLLAQLPHSSRRFHPKSDPRLPKSLVLIGCLVDGLNSD
jgi:RNA-directed DNA polymerase